MKMSMFSAENTLEVIELFTGVFSDSEGDSEGKSIGQLVANLISTTPSNDLVGCIATDNGHIVGSIFFSRFCVPDGQLAFILSPVAVSPKVQGIGIGQKLIRYGLDHLKSLEVDLVFTYGDPNFYSRTGFEQISEDVVKAPFILSQPIGWLAQSLDGKTIQAIPGDTKCVAALSHQEYW